MSDVKAKLEAELGKAVDQADNTEIYRGLLNLTNKAAAEKTVHDSKKKLYYISAEFLIGKLLSNNLINLGLYDEVKELLSQNGKSMAEIEEIETEPSLGNGGLGRLAACFVDSIATLGLPGDGVGLNYHFGLFKQSFRDNVQVETADRWRSGDTWLIDTNKGYDVVMGGKTYHSRMYDLKVTGYEGVTNALHLFDMDTVDESIVKDGIAFDKTDIAKNLTLFLYPDDSDDDGRKLRVYQQYFMVSNAAHLIIEEAVERGSKLTDLFDYAVIQINDTHPTMVIPELIRILRDEKGIDFDEAVDIVSKCCAYTNHTILAEALEKWPIKYLKEIVPQLVPIIEILDDRVRRKFSDESVAIIDSEDRVHMAHIDIHYGFSVNGVAALHTDILKNTELKNFYDLYPDKFNNKTNGITFRRWLLACNPELSEFIISKIGRDFLKHSDKLADFEKYLDDRAVLDKLLEIKAGKKRNLCAYLKETRGIEIDPESIFDIQSKRLHEYKRQQLNLLWCIKRYQQIKAGMKPKRKVTVMFASKAAPAYIIAKDIIHAILCLQEIVNNDPDVKDYLQILMIDNYNVTLAEKLIPDCDISEQISLASKEASGTGNMKYMLNGALTLGTEDGANVEIHERVGDGNIYIFGMRSPEVIKKYANASYVSKEYYDRDEILKKAVDFLIGDEMVKVGNEQQLKRLYDELLKKDWFMTFPDFQAYSGTREMVYAEYENRLGWAKKMGINIARAGFFSSDRTIEEYNRDIWHLK